ncbi:ArsR family transcriptional regulator [Methanoregula sp.]|uniref:flavodoxin family protein n=1 Tax=Methanoregula sp. TaxID=2052170 RepID=UPI000CBB302E|nr:ArsR family transcriptional regulator [Methanoregula sp.]PKG31996.1 MAG: ArsR family transcriptional regulator [Methanoregula sp.]
MKLTIICASYTGTTYGIAEQIRNACGGEIIEIQSKDLLSRVVAFMGRHSPGMNVRESGSLPEKIDLSGSDLVVIGTPVWGGKPVPAIRKAFAVLTGCKGKKAVIFATCGENPGTTLQILEKDLAAKGMTIAGQFSLKKKEIEDGTLVAALIAKVQEAADPA